MVGPWIQTSPIARVPGPIVTGPVIVQRGPIWTSSARSTSPSIDAVGWIFGTGEILRSLKTGYRTEVSKARPESPQVAIEVLGRMSYADALALQRERHHALVEARGGGGGPMSLLLVEHDPPVVTLTRRPGVSEHLLVDEAQLAAMGIQLAQTDRGGDITYHGPGQLVAYPILDLNVLDLRIHSYMRLLEVVVIRTLAAFGIQAMREEEATGVWVPAEEGRARKIAALGVRLSRWCSMHGLAINVDPDLSHFDLIVPCGLVDRSVTSMRQELGSDCPTLEQVREQLVDQFMAVLDDPLLGRNKT